MRINDMGPKVSNLPQNPNTGIQNSGQDFKQLLDKAVSSKEDKQLQEVSRQFEAVFIYQMFERLRETTSEGGLLPKSMGEKVFQSMLDQEFSAKAAETGSLGLAELIYKQLKVK